ncbi:hypothetical protein FJTKL_13515 [Diaporthe vaccinii]|uniref:Acyltransferase 3 domain-containing protein n=1 Tax=Diaporthe vaccinii TaxID=105482 RepID=A0ABR4EA42_9PEZI
MQPENNQELPNFRQLSPQPLQPCGVQHIWNDPLKGLTPRHIALCVLDFFTPEVLSRRKKPKGRPLDEQHKTAWLDGLRGWAALLVCVFHLTLWTHDGINYCYGAILPSGAQNITPAAWPVVRTLWTGGHFSVALFFTVSGYVLPKRLLSLLHAGRQTDFVEALHSSVIRRPLRLFLPVVWSTLAATVVSYLTGIPTSAMGRENSMLLQLVAWVRETGRYLYFFDGGYHAVNQHTWSLVVEMRGSMSLFVWLFALSRMQHRTRFFLTLAMIWYLVVAVPAAQMATFFAGMATAELDLVASGAVQMRLPWDGLVQAVGRHVLVRKLVSHAVLIGALYLGAEPSGSSVDSSRGEVLGKCRGWMTLEWLIPEAYPHDGDDPSWLWFWLFWAAWVFLLAVKEIAWLKRALSGGFSQYLGRVSFPLYLTHGPMIGFFSERLFYLTGVKKNMDEGAMSMFGSIENKWYGASWFPFTDQGSYGLEPNYLFCLVVSIVVFLYVAELGAKSIEAPSVRFSRWAYGRYFKGS